MLHKADEASIKTSRNAYCVSLTSNGHLPDQGSYDVPDREEDYGCHHHYEAQLPAVVGHRAPIPPRHTPGDKPLNATVPLQFLTIAQCLNPVNPETSAGTARYLKGHVN